MHNDLGNVDLNPNFHTAFAKAHALMPQKAQQAFMVLKMVFEDGLSQLTTPLEVYLRRRFGVRAISLFQLLQLTSFLILSWLFLSPLIACFLLGAAVLCGWHMYEAYRWEKSKRPWRYSYFIGESLPFWVVVERFLRRRGLRPDRELLPNLIYRFGEPGLCFVCGLLVVLLSRNFGLFLIGGSFALLLKMHLLHMRVKNLLRDKNDASVMGQILCKFTDEPGKDEDGELPVVTLVPPPGPKFPSAKAEALKSESEDANDLSEAAEATITEEIPIAESTADTVIRVRCRTCGRKMKAPSKHAGRAAKCPACGDTIKIPEIATAQAC